MSDIEKRVAALEEGFAALEEAVRRLQTKNRGYLNQKQAAQYLGRSVEYLRSCHANGTGPRRMENGMYSYADLDAWMGRDQPLE